MQTAIDDMFHYESIDVNPFPKTFKTTNELDKFLKKQNASIQPLIKEEYKDKFDKLISILKSRLINPD